jgi:hypothetical protein
VPDPGDATQRDNGPFSVQIGFFTADYLQKPGSIAASALVDQDQCAGLRWIEYKMWTCIDAFSLRYCLLWVWRRQPAQGENY